MEKQQPRQFSARRSMRPRNLLRPQRNWQKAKYILTRMLARHTIQSFKFGFHGKFRRAEIGVHRVLMDTWSSQHRSLYEATDHDLMNDTFIDIESDTESFLDELFQETFPRTRSPLVRFRELDITQGYGAYECYRCENYWTSAHADAEFWQECRVCNTRCYPLNVVHRSGVSPRRTRPHIRQRCQKCMETGVFCNDKQPIQAPIETTSYSNANYN